MWLLLAAALASEVRREEGGPALPEEVRAAEILRAPCDPRWSVIPGAWQRCTGDKQYGNFLLALTTVEAAAGITVVLSSPAPDGVSGFESGRYTLLLAATEPMVVSSMDVLFTQQRARRLRYVPMDTPRELWTAPFRPKVLARPSVWAGTLVLAGAAIGVDVAFFDAGPPKIGPVNVFGAHAPPAIGYPTVALLDAGLMIQVATAEEMLFRGWIQSGLARRTGEANGVVLGSLLFGAVHASNAIFLAPEDRAAYLLYGVPFITLTGTWLSLTYHWAGYSLSPSIAQHFWYNTIVSTSAAIFDPEHHMFSLRLGGPI